MRGDHERGSTAHVSDQTRIEGVIYRADLDISSTSTCILCEECDTPTPNSIATPFHHRAECCGGLPDERLTKEPIQVPESRVSACAPNLGACPKGWNPTRRMPIKRGKCGLYDFCGDETTDGGSLVAYDASPTSQIDSSRKARELEPQSQFHSGSAKDDQTHDMPCFHRCTFRFRFLKRLTHC